MSRADAVNEEVLKLFGRAHQFLVGNLWSNFLGGDEARYRQFPLASLTNRLFINIGAGNFGHRYWTNLDYGTSHYSNHQKRPFINFNLMDCAPLPFADDSIEICYTSHTIEHINTAAAENIFREVWRVLKHGGVFRLTCPDAELFRKSVILDRADYWFWRRPWFVKAGGDPEKIRPAEFLIREIATERSFYVKEGKNKLTREEVEREIYHRKPEDFFDWLIAPCRFNPQVPGWHINWWTDTKCNKLMQKAGFSNIYRSSFGASMSIPLQDTLFFDNTFPPMSLYMEAIKD